MIDLPVSSAEYEATLTGHRRAHVLTRTIGVPHRGEAVRIAEVDTDGLKTGRCCFARITHVEHAGNVAVLSFDVRMSSDRMLAVSE